MGRVISNQVIDSILTAVSRFPQGASLEDVREFTALPRRSVQRYLALLVKEGNLEALGKARARKYRLSFYEEDVFWSGMSMREEMLPPELPIPLSSQALSVQSDVCKPIDACQPVGYNRDFLEKYRPNKTHYLSEKERKHLLETQKGFGKFVIQHSEREGSYAQQILHYLLVDLSWNSCRLEGNSYSLLETQRLLELGQPSSAKDFTETQMLLNHKAAIHFLVDLAQGPRLTREVILKVHKLLADQLVQDPRACGSLRIRPVGIKHSVYQPIAIPQMIDKYFQKILDTAYAIKDPFEQSFFAMVHLPYLQPFLDVNKQLSRIAANISLIRKNLCPLTFVDVPEQIYNNGLLGIYELNRTELLREIFIWAYEQSSTIYSKKSKEGPAYLKFHDLVLPLVEEIVQSCMGKTAAIDLIRKKAAEMEKEGDRAPFIETIERELIHLHPDNIGRFRLSLSEYKVWLKTWC